MEMKHKVKGWGVDSAPAAQPGVPMEKVSPSPVPGTHWTKPEQQPLAEGVLKHKLRKDFSATFGTSVPPRGLSGALKKFAYKIPEHRPEKWLLTLLSDRIDVLEHGKLGKAHLMPMSMFGALAGLLTWKLIKPKPAE